jgi:arylsulfatase A-like enzyme
MLALGLTSRFAAGLLLEQVPLSPEQNLQPPASPALGHGRPNIIFILTDDQDIHLDSLQYMPFVQKHLLHQGTYFAKHYCTTAVCCPARATLWTGKAAHNTNVTDVNPPYGGYPKFVSQGFNEKYLPVWLQQAGYNTYYTGKLFNAHTVENYNSPYPAGFTSTVCSSVSCP